MTEKELGAELDRVPFMPFRLHLVSGKTFDILAAGVGHTLSNALLVLRNPTAGTSRVEGYDVIAYQNIERIERLELGQRPVGRAKRKPA